MKIGDIERLTGVSAATIRYWEERGLLCADRSDNRYRDYSAEDASLILHLKLLRELGTPIADIKLWRDSLIDERGLLLAQRRRLDSGEGESRRLRELCDRLLRGEDCVNDSAAPFSESEKIPEGKLALGVDLGTTSISAQLISLNDGRAIHTYSIDHNAATESEYAFTADAEKLLQAAIGLVRSALGSYKSIAAIGFTGQMHGIVCLDSDGGILSPLYTWQNRFGLHTLDSGETVCEELTRLCGCSFPTGYGLVTCYALKRLGLLPESTAKIACISDVAVMRLCGLKKPIIHPTNAASLGFYELEKAHFDTASLDRLGLDEAVLPEISSDLALCGELDGVPVSVSIGDNQAGAFGSLRSGELLFNVGTSGQVSFVSDSPLARAGEARPYFEGRYLHSGSVLCGGRALAILADFITDIAERLGCPTPKKTVYELINSSALESVGALEISTAFAGTRTAPELRGSITGIGTASFKLAELSDGFCRGIVDELSGLLAEMTDSPPKRQVISGNALRRSPALRRAVAARFGSEPMLPRHTEEAAYGAALYAAVAAGLLTYESSRELIGYENTNG